LVEVATNAGQDDVENNADGVGDAAAAHREDDAGDEGDAAAKAEGGAEGASAVGKWLTSMMSSFSKPIFSAVSSGAMRSPHSPGVCLLEPTVKLTRDACKPR